MVNEKVDGLGSHTGRLGNIERDVAATAKSVQGVATGTDAVSSFVSGPNDHSDNIRLVVGHNVNEIRKPDEDENVILREGP